MTVLRKGAVNRRETSEDKKYRTLRPLIPAADDNARQKYFEAVSYLLNPET
jgi:hypothetical protein